MEAGGWAAYGICAIVVIMTHETSGNAGPEQSRYGAIQGGSPDANVLLEASRPKFYELASTVITAQAQHDMLIRTTRPPYGLITYDTTVKKPHEHVIEELHSWDELHEAMLWTGIRGIEAFLGRRHTIAMEATLYKFRKMTQMFDALATPAGGIRGYESVEALLVGGYVTGTDVIIGGLQSTGETVQAALPDLSAQQVARITKNSSTVAAQPANTPFDHIQHTLNAIDIAPKATPEQLRLGRFSRVDPKLLTLNESEQRVRYTKQFKEHVDRVLGVKITDMPSRFPTLGCPALRNMVIKQYWQWGAEVAYRAGLWGVPTADTTLM